MTSTPRAVGRTASTHVRASPELMTDGRIPTCGAFGSSTTRSGPLAMTRRPLPSAIRYTNGATSLSGPPPRRAAKTLSCESAPSPKARRAAPRAPPASQPASLSRAGSASCEDASGLRTRRAWRRWRKITEASASTSLSASVMVTSASCLRRCHPRAEQRSALS
ncbi:hypothetical protein ACFPRL_08940 [Pseudoclavibacter helvolus]